MARTRTREIDEDMADVLRRSTIKQGADDWLLILPTQLTRELYARVNAILEAEGGQWDRYAKAHVFPSDPAERLCRALEAGEVILANEGWFPTPPLIVDQMLDLAPWDGGEILEPSAGEGAIATVIRNIWPDAELYLLCVERNEQRAKVLEAKGFSVVQADFLTYPLPSVFTRCWLNPPFENGQDITHTLRAYSLLAPGGKLVGIISQGPFFRQDRQACKFREWLAAFDMRMQVHDLPDDAFKSSGTNVRTRMIYLEKE